MKPITIDTANGLCAALFIGLGAFFAIESLGLEIGTAFRMGPGYFPLLLSAALVILGLIILVQATRVEGEPIGLIAWRGMLLILPAPIFFGLTVRGLGFLPSIFLTALIASFASQRMKPWHGDRALCGRHAVFLHRLQLWARPAVPAVRPLAVVLGARDGSPRQSRTRLRHRNNPLEPAVLPDRRAARHADRRAARHRRDRHHRHAVADHLPDRRSGLVADHAVRHLLRRAVWRLDHRHPDQHAGRILLCRHRDRRLPDGAQRPRGRGPRHRRHRLVLRRHRLDLPRRHLRAAADGDRAGIRRGRVFFADGRRPRLVDRARPRLHRQGARHGRARPAARPRRHRHLHRHAALHARHPRICRRAEFRRRRRRRLRRRGNPAQSRKRA